MNSEETSAQTFLRMIKRAFLAFAMLFGVLGVAFVIFLYSHSIPTTTIDLVTVARDTTFFVGAARSQRGEGNTVSIRAVGQVDDSTAGILVTYPNDTQVAIKGSLMDGRIDQLWVGNFYDRRAKITFLHNAVQHGHLRLQVHFSYPPASWGYRPTNQGWVKAR